MPTPLIEILEKLNQGTIVLLGDLMVDRYLYGNAERLSPEAPVPVLHYQNEEMRLGGCGSVAADLAVLGRYLRLGRARAENQLPWAARRQVDKQEAEHDRHGDGHQRQEGAAGQVAGHYEPAGRMLDSCGKTELPDDSGTWTFEES